jgi:hypothetical protein
MLLAAAVVVALTPLAKAEGPYPGQDQWSFWISPAVHSADAFPPLGLWKSETDTHLDGELREATTRQLVLECANGQLSGRDEGVLAGEQQPASVYGGQLIPGAPGIVTLRRDDRQGWTTVYTGRQVAEGHIIGCYVDNRGTSGDWSLTFVSASILEPVAQSAPDELLYESVLGIYGKAIRGARHPYINLRPPVRNLWTEEIQEFIGASLSYEEVDYIGTAKMIIPETGVYTVDIPGEGVEFRVNGQRLASGDVKLKRGVYEIEIYTNHWGQPYLTYAEVTVDKAGTDVRIPFVNTAADIEAFRTQTISDQLVVEVCDYDAQRFDPLRD